MKGMERDIPRYRNITDFVNGVKFQMVSAQEFLKTLPQPFGINFNINKETTGRGIYYRRQINATQNDVIFVEYEDKESLYYDPVEKTGKFNERKELLGFENYVLEELGKRGIVSKNSELELIVFKKPVQNE